MNQVGNDKSDEISKATRRLINELKDRPYTNLARLVEDNLDYWENELFPILEQENRPKYRVVVNEIFIPCGYHFTEKQVADAVSYVRAKRFRKEMKSKK